MTRSIPSPRSPGFLRFALLADAAASGVLGLGMTVLAGPLAHLLGLPEALPRTVGLVLIVWAAAVLWLGTRSRPSPRRLGGDRAHRSQIGRSSGREDVCQYVLVYVVDVTLKK